MKGGFKKFFFTQECVILGFESIRKKFGTPTLKFFFKKLSFGGGGGGGLMPICKKVTFRFFKPYLSITR